MMTERCSAREAKASRPTYEVREQEGRLDGASGAPKLVGP
jgi:hypothetical protein